MAKVVLNGELVDEANACLPVLDWGLLYGYGLFETMRAYKGKVFRLDDHLDRLMKSSLAINLNFNASKRKLAKQVFAVLIANKLADAYVRLTVTYGASEPRLAFERKAKPNVYVVARPIPENIGELQKKGVKLSVSGKFVRDPESPLTYIKSTNYLLSALAKKEASSAGAFDVLMLNTDGFMAETSTANVFTVKDGELSTPSVESGILPGITRKTVLEIAEESGIPSKEKEMTVMEFSESDEAFLTNSTLELVPVVSFDGRRVGSGKPGKTTRKLLMEYGKLVSEETR
jgi:branched-chain amino acid aminotransferase